MGWVGGGSSGWAGSVERGGSGFRARHSTAQHSTSQHTTAQHNIQHSTAYYSTTQHNTAPTAAQESLPPSLPPSLPSLPPSHPVISLLVWLRLGRVCLFFFFRFFFSSRVLSRQLTKVRTPKKFQYMREAQHIGKVVVTQPMLLCREATYLITGGLGYVGQLVA